MKTLQNLTWDNLWKETRVDLHYPVRIYGMVVSAMLLLQAFWQTQLGIVPNWILWANVAMAWGGTKLTEKKTHSVKFFANNSDDGLS